MTACRAGIVCGTVRRGAAMLCTCLALVLMASVACAEPPSGDERRLRSGATGTAADPLSAHIREAAKRFDIPGRWIRAVMHAESVGDVRAVSPKGAIGLMQIMPATWDELRIKHGLGNDPFQPRDNILAGAAYLREMLDRFGRKGFLAAYNAGPTRFEEYLKKDRPLPSETVNYVRKLAPLIDGTIAIPTPIRRGTDTMNVAGATIFARRTNTADDAAPPIEAAAGMPAGTVFSAIRSRIGRSPAGGSVVHLPALGLQMGGVPENSASQPETRSSALFARR
jgi:hypothetical protein